MKTVRRQAIEVVIKPAKAGEVYRRAVASMPGSRFEPVTAECFDIPDDSENYMRAARSFAGRHCLYGDYVGAPTKNGFVFIDTSSR